jgi:glycosyltransferase involved in cell wall biosynthesis
MNRFALLIPVYNNLKTLPETLASVLQLDSAGKIELVVSDDASTDSSQEFLRLWFDEHGASFARAKLLLNTHNVGISENHARAFAAVASEYGLYIGGDDFIDNPHLFCELEVALETMPRMAIAKLDVEAFYRFDGRRELICRARSYFFRMSSARQFAALALYGNFLYAGAGTLLHIPTLRQIGGGFDSRFKTYEDLPLFLSFLAAGHRMVFIPLRGVVWVRGTSSLSRRGFAGTRERFEKEGGLITRIVKAHWNLLSIHERMLYRAKVLPKYLRYVIFASSLPWLHLRLMPSIVKKAKSIGRR